MAKAVNCLALTDGSPCGECAMCEAIGAGKSPDILEIDGASNTGIEDIRALRDRAAYTPTEARFKVYIIDEVHRLSASAFDGLLKTLEEPPPHVLFIFASTEPHKVPATILSRCQRFDFHRIARETTINRLKEVTAEEGMSLDDGAALLITQQASGSLRDALGILDQVRAFAGDSISADDVRAGTGLGRPEIIAALSGQMVEGSIGEGLATIHKSVTQGVDPRTLRRQLIEYWRGLLLYVGHSGSIADLDPMLDEAAAVHASSLTAGQVIDVLRALTEEIVEPRLSVAPELPLEIAVVEATLVLQGGRTSGSGRGGEGDYPSGALQTQPVLAVRESEEDGVTGASVGARPRKSRARVGSPADSVVPRGASNPDPDDSGSHAQALSAIQEASAGDTPAEECQEIATAELGTAETASRLTESWPAILESARARSRRLQGLLRDAHVVQVVDSEVTLGFRYPFHRDESDKPENRAAAERIIEEVTGLRVKVRCIRAANGDSEGSRDDSEAFIADAERMLRSVHALQFRSSKPEA